MALPELAVTFECYLGLQCIQKTYSETNNVPSTPVELMKLLYVNNIQKLILGRKIKIKDKQKKLLTFLPFQLI